ncbi:MAG: hypothetical protein M3454_11275 [Actinomycetota bacterium]|nr:hypothetical protein [Actinomycetota bacterium]
MTWADLRDADLSEARNLNLATVVNVKFNDATRWPEGFTPPPAAV